MHGNMHLIVELYKHNLIRPSIIVTCIDEMFEEVNNSNIDILCQMIHKLSAYQVSKTKREREEAAANPKSKKEVAPSKKSSIDLEYIDSHLSKLFKHRNNTSIETRVRFKIQDLMDDYEKVWKFEIYNSRQRQNSVDSDGFKMKYVPKNSILTEDQIKAQGK